MDAFIRMLVSMLKESKAGYVSTRLGDVTIIVSDHQETIDAMLKAADGGKDD